MSATTEHGATRPALTEPFEIGGVPISNRVLLAPLAGIGNWFVRLQAKRHGAGLAVSEMVSSFALHYRNERTLRELMRIHPDEHPVSVQLFGHDAEVMRSGARDRRRGRRRPDRHQHGLPGAEGPPHRRRRPAPARPGAGPGPGPRRHRRRGGVPVTVKLRSGIEAGDRSGFELAMRLAEEAGVAAIAFHPRAATKGHKGKPDYELTRELVERVEVPVIVSGGLSSADAARRAYEESGADAVMIARGSLGNPWLFEELTGPRSRAARPGRGRRRAALGDRRAPRSTSAPSGRSATCASSTPGTWSVSRPRWRSPRSCSAAPASVAPES